MSAESEASGHIGIKIHSSEREQTRNTEQAFAELKSYFKVKITHPPDYKGYAIVDSARSESKPKLAGNKTLHAMLFERMMGDESGEVSPHEMMVVTVQQNEKIKSRWLVSENGVEAYNLTQNEIPIEGWHDAFEFPDMQDFHDQVYDLTELTRRPPDIKTLLGHVWSNSPFSNNNHNNH